MTENEAKWEYCRAIDLIKQIKTEETHERYIDRHKAFDLAIQALEKVQKFEAIGTIEEFKALKEKNETLKALYEDVRKEGNNLIVKARTETVNELDKLIETIARDTRIGRNSCEAIVEDINRLAEEYEAVAKNATTTWILVSERLPEEHDSMFAKFKGTDKWKSAMFEKISDVVNVTVADENGKAVTTHAHTIDGKWCCDLLGLNKSCRITAWCPYPAPYQPEENSKDCSSCAKQHSAG